jgi:hypothetical protein
MSSEQVKRAPRYELVGGVMRVRKDRTVDALTWVGTLSPQERAQLMTSINQGGEFRSTKENMDRYREIGVGDTYVALQRIALDMTAERPTEHKFEIQPTMKGNLYTETVCKGTISARYGYGTEMSAKGIDRAKAAALIVSTFFVAKKDGSVALSQQPKERSVRKLFAKYLPDDLWLMQASKGKDAKTIYQAFVDLYHRYEHMIPDQNTQIMESVPLYFKGAKSAPIDKPERSIIMRARPPVATSFGKHEAFEIEKVIQQMITARGPSKSGLGYVAESHMLGMPMIPSLQDLVEKVADYTPVDIHGVIFVNTSNPTLATAIYRVQREAYKDRHTVVVHTGKFDDPKKFEKIVVNDTDGPKLIGSGVIAMNRFNWNDQFRGMPSHFVDFNSVTRGRGKGSKTMASSAKMHRAYVEHELHTFDTYQCYMHIAAVTDERTLPSMRARKGVVVLQKGVKGMTPAEAMLQVYNSVRHSILYPWLAGTMYMRGKDGQYLYPNVRKIDGITFDFTPMKESEGIIISDEVDKGDSMQEMEAEFDRVFTLAATGTAAQKDEASAAFNELRKAVEKKENTAANSQEEDEASDNELDLDLYDQ